MVTESVSATSNLPQSKMRRIKAIDIALFTTDVIVALRKLNKTNFNIMSIDMHDALISVLDTHAPLRNSRPRTRISEPWMKPDILQDSSRGAIQMHTPTCSQRDVHHSATRGEPSHKRS